MHYRRLKEDLVARDNQFIEHMNRLLEEACAKHLYEEDAQISPLPDLPENMGFFDFYQDYFPLLQRLVAEEDKDNVADNLGISRKEVAAVAAGQTRSDKIALALLITIEAKIRDLIKEIEYFAGLRRKTGIGFRLFLSPRVQQPDR